MIGKLSPLKSAVGLKVYVPLPLSTIFPYDESILTEVTVKVSPSSSLAFCSNCSCVNIIDVSSFVEPRSTFSTTAASFTVVTAGSKFCTVWLEPSTPALVAVTLNAGNSCPELTKLAPASVSVTSPVVSLIA